VETVTCAESGSVDEEAPVLLLLVVVELLASRCDTFGGVTTKYHVMTQIMRNNTPMIIIRILLDFIQVIEATYP